MKLIEAKAAGKRITVPQAAEEPVIINLMDALRQSLDQARHGETAKRDGKAGKRTKAHHAGKAPRHPRRKTA